MKFNIIGILKLSVLFFVMTLGFYVLYGLILGVPTTAVSTLFLILVSALSAFVCFMWCKKGGNEDA